MIGDEVNKFIIKYGVATVVVFEMIEMLSEQEVYHMGYVNGTMLANKGINVPQKVIVEANPFGNLIKFILAGDLSRYENYIYRNIMMGFSGKEHGYLGMSVERHVL